MKKILPLLFAAITALLLSSCKKDADKTSSGSKSTTTSYKVDYTISPADVYITQVTYIDSIGATITANDLSAFTSGVKTIHILSKPFKAKLSIRVDNTTNTTHNYYLAITVDGTVQKYVPMSVPPHATSYDGEAEYELQ